MIPDITYDNNTQNCNNPEPKIYMKKLYSQVKTGPIMPSQNLWGRGYEPVTDCVSFIQSGILVIKEKV